ncbi:hypothetical protein [Micromonospora sp. WMMD964]|uniref:hypothetical protein n=1 Tax=Micromonospora sp. WMMD964 TaxID=3016091 RepID=UPI00249A9EC4|nr:hypothetical protein [Micromonospora sp. WMMD964]WFE99311.1 hypothetical protein O7616_20715 [Micromonospora sp. WMMD964]
MRSHAGHPRIGGTRTARQLSGVTSYDWSVSLGAMPLGYAPVPLAVAGLLVLVSCAGTSLVPGVRRLTWPTPPQPRPADAAGVR